MLNTLGGDIIIFQEIKIQRKDLEDDMVLMTGWDAFFTFPKYQHGKIFIFSLSSGHLP
jgi:AP endonuclease-2